MAVNQLKAGVVLNYVVIVLNILVGLLYTPFMLHKMGQSEYGLYSLVASVISYLTVLDLGLGNAIIRYTAKYRAENKVKQQYEMFGMFLILYIIIGLIALIIGLGLYFNVYNMFGETMTALELDRARIMILILVFNVAFTFPMSIFGSIITAYERFVFPKIINIIRTVLNTGIMIILLLNGYKAIAMVVLMTFFNVFTLIINYIYCKRELQIKLHFAKFKMDFFREVAIYSFWIFLNVIMDRIYWSTGQFILGAVSGTVAVSVFAIAIQLQGMYMMFSTAISSVFLPKVTGMVVKSDNHKEISDLFIRAGRIQNIIMSLILFGFITFGLQFVNLWAGEEYLDAYYMTVAFFVALYIPMIQNLGITILQARNQMKFRSILYIIIAVLALIAEVILSKLWGGIGCAIAVASALFLGQGIVMNIYYKHKQYINIGEFWKEILKMNIAPIIISAVFIYLTNKYLIINSWYTLVLGILAYVITYIPLCVCVSMNQYERNLFVLPLKNVFHR